MKAIVIKKVYPPYSDTLHEWHKPETKRQKELWDEHEADLLKVFRTGKCPCGASIEPSGVEYQNRLLDLGYLYGIECLSCR